MKLITCLAVVTAFIPFITHANFAQAPDNGLGARLIHDINFDGVADFASYNADGYYPKYEVFSGADGTLIKEFTVPDNLSWTKVHWLDDRNNDGVQDVGFFGQNIISKKYLFILKNGYSGETIKTWSWNDTLANVEFVELSDMTGDNISEFAIFGVHNKNATLQLQIRDGKFRNLVNIFKWPNNWDDPKVVSLSDITGDNISEIAVYGKHKRRGNGQLFVFDGVNPTNKLDVYNWVKNWDVTSLYVLDDLNKDGTLDLGQFGRRYDDNRYQMVIKHGSTKVGTVRTLTWNTNIKVNTPLILDDFTGDDVREIAIAGMDYSDARYKALINDGRLPNSRLKNISWPQGKWHLGSVVIELHDFDGDGVKEIGLVGAASPSKRITLSVKSIVTGKQLALYEWDHQWNAYHIESVDSNADGVLDVALIGRKQHTLSSRVSVIDGTNSRNVFYDKILDDALISLTSFISAKSGDDYRYTSYFNDALRADRGEDQLLFDGTNINNGSNLIPYEIENSLLSVFTGNTLNIHDFLYVADGFAVATDEQGQLSVYSSIESTSKNIINVWNTLELIDKTFHFLSYGTMGSSSSHKAIVNSVGFVDDDIAFVNFDGQFYSVPWNINEQGQLVIELSQSSDLDDLIYNCLATNGKVSYLTDTNRNNKPSIMSDNFTNMSTLFSLWLTNQ
ncbi:hypothetical protein LCGC14_0306420 [marine sediment metagenome]|uniref:Uncharacterized protein n=1 Tax=marine sediment metagenome TaxID=412755 RepID=A0A0F9TTL0_9ZZZZ